MPLISNLVEKRHPFARKIPLCLRNLEAFTVDPVVIHLLESISEGFNETEVVLLKYVLSPAIALKKLFIGTCEHWEIKMMEKMKQFLQSSTNVEFIYKSSIMLTNKRSGESSAADRISSLSCDLLQKILGCLPLEDAVRTSVLSREWRYKWVVRSELVFNYNTDKEELVFNYNTDKELLLKTSIYKVLLIHQGELRKFSLLVPSSKIFSDIDTWILFLSNKNVQELSLVFLTCDNFRLPSHLFKFQDLKHLELTSCKFYPPPNFKGFRSLVTLKFCSVTFEPTSFQNLLLSSPLLERVSMIWCTEFDSFIIEAPNLKIFEFMGMANSLCFGTTPLLEEIVFGLPFNLFESFAVPESQLSLHNIKILNLKGLVFVDVEWVAYVLYLINRCPKIERLLITSCNFEECVAHPLQSQEMTMTHSALKRLKSVDMTLMWFSEDEMEFLKHVLAFAIALEKIYIARSTCAEYRHRGMKMMEEMMRFPRASPNVEFIYIIED